MTQPKLVFQALLLALIVLLCAFAYQLALPGIWLYDDGPSLRGLEQVEDWLSGLVYSLDGFTGPLGRPLALASFALQAEHWPDNPAAFLRVNILIHCVNALLVFFVSLALGRFLAPGSARLGWFALLVTALWAFSPFLASASLMIVQRMATLSATFVFLGVLLYTHGRWISADRPRAGLVLVSAAVLVCTPLAVFTKESGALLPVLLLLVELLVVRPSSAARARLPGWWLVLFLALPTLLILGYLASRGVSGAGYARRDFDLGERLLSQARILWDYIGNLLLPQTAAVTPYMDGYPASRGWFEPASTIWAFVGIAGLVGAALFSIRVIPVASFGILFFFGAHLLESTVISLELYFAHRNYVGALGVYILVAYLLVFSRLAREKTKIATLAAGAYILTFFMVLVSSASLWGNEELASEMWLLRNDSSIRAAQGLARVYLRQGDPVAANHLIEQTLENFPGRQILSVQALQFCHFGEDDYLSRLKRAANAIQPPRRLNHAAASELYRLAQSLGNSDCAFIDSKKMRALLMLALEESHRHANTRTTVLLHYAMAHLAQLDGETTLMRKALKNSFEIERDTQTAVLIAYSWVLEQDFDRARAFLAEQLAGKSPGGLEAVLWRRELEGYLDQLQQEPM